ncbi:ABC transporter substrate-binding protein [Angelakisella massiliensis]|uniref:ABC transporter substrate-binding protein n=1 Tax=Angelakisella massiliensis TaxID=1871018 RepID=UPI0008F8C858|nr:ABC transporter substrate-binding protein [Angelakisella massiliensis]
MKISIRKLFALLLSICMILSCSACGQTAASSQGEPAASGSSSADAANSGEEITLSIAVNQSWNKPNFEPLLKKYEEQNPGIKFDLQVIPDGQFDELLLSKLRTGEGPDMVHYGMTQLFQKYSVDETLVPLDDEAWVKDLINPDSVTVNGHIYGAPSNSMGAISGLIYNEKMFEENGVAVPTTWDEFLTVCETFKSKGITPIMIPGKDAWTIGMWICTMFPNVIVDQAPEIYDKINTQEVKYADIPGFADCLDKMKELVDKGYVNSDYLSTTVDMGLVMLMEEKAAMAVSGDYWISDVYAKDPESRLRMAPLPVVDNARLTCGTIRVVSIFNSSEHIDECKKFLNFLQESEQQVATNSDWGTLPAMNGVEMELPAWTQAVNDNYVSKGQVPLEQLGMRQYVGTGEMTTLTYEVLMGNMSSLEALQEWDIYYEKLAREQKFPGWENK